MDGPLSKTHNFMDFWHSFWWRLWRPWILLSTKSKCHKSNFRIIWMYRYHFYDLKVHFWWLIRMFFSRISSLNTLYTLCICKMAKNQKVWWNFFFEIVKSNNKFGIFCSTWRNSARRHSSFESHKIWINFITTTPIHQWPCFTAAISQESLKIPVIAL